MERDPSTETLALTPQNSSSFATRIPVSSGTRPKHLQYGFLQRYEHILENVQSCSCGKDVRYKRTARVSSLQTKTREVFLVQARPGLEIVMRNWQKTQSLGHSIAY